MNKFIQKTLMVIGIAILVIVFSLNIVYVTQIADDIWEATTIKKYSILNLAITALIVIGISVISKKINNINITKRTKLLIFILLIFVYLIGQLIWIKTIDSKPVADQAKVYDVAVNIYNDNLENIKDYNYLEFYPYQITLANVYAVIFKMFGGPNVNVLRVCNAIANVLTVIGTILITKQLSKEYKVNLSKTLIIILTFATLPLLSTFIYGDFISLPMCLFSIYFIMKYSRESKNRYAIISAVFMAIAYMARMNNLIYIIAITIYMILDILKADKQSVKEICKKVLIILIVIAISLLPTIIVKDNFQNKLQLDKDRTFPATGFIYMGMEESSRGNGWYNESLVFPGWRDLDKYKQEYKEGIINRLQYFVENPIYTIQFYIDKTASMWTENTYGGIWYNQSFNTSHVVEEQKQYEWLDKELLKIREGLTIYQKALILTIFGSTILVLVKYRNKLSNEVLLLITIFIGGFLFHTLWEAKSRYIISYIIVLIPIASISLEHNFIKYIKDRIGEKYGKNK